MKKKAMMNNYYLVDIIKQMFNNIDFDYENKIGSVNLFRIFLGTDCNLDDADILIKSHENLKKFLVKTVQHDLILFDNNCGHIYKMSHIEKAVDAFIDNIKYALSTRLNWLERNKTGAWQDNN